MSNMCPVCGYANLDKPAYFDSSGAWPSFEYCPSCGFQFGYTDRALHITFEEWRRQWIAKGMTWNIEQIKPPADWNPRQQLLSIGVKV